MVQYLFEKGKEELLKHRGRTLVQETGTRHWVTMFDVAWRWFDRLDKHEFGMPKEKMLQRAIDRSAENQKPIGDNLQCVVEDIIRSRDSGNIDVTEELDVLLQQQLIHEAFQRFHERKRERRYSQTPDVDDNGDPAT